MSCACVPRLIARIAPLLLAFAGCGDTGETPPKGQAGTSGASGSGGNGASAGSAGAAGSGGTGAAGSGAEAGAAGAAGTEAGGCDPGTGKALSFRGDVIDLIAGELGPDLPSGNAARTVELWAHFTGEASWEPGHTLIELGRRVDGDNQVFGLDMSGRDGENGLFDPYTNNSGDNDSTPVLLAPEGWYHLALGYDGAGHFQFVVNGALVPLQNPGDGTAVLATTPSIVTLGGSQNFGWQGWEGVMDEIRIWDVFRSEAEIARDMKVKLTGSEPGLVAYYDLDKGHGVTVDDVLKKAGHKLTLCPANGGPCPAPAVQAPTWVDSDIPGPFTCAP